MYTEFGGPHLGRAYLRRFGNKDDPPERRVYSLDLYSDAFEDYPRLAGLRLGNAIEIWCLCVEQPIGPGAHIELTSFIIQKTDPAPPAAGPNGGIFVMGEGEGEGESDDDDDDSAADSAAADDDDTSTAGPSAAGENDVEDDDEDSDDVEEEEDED
ncbi:hypothetical protein Dsin_015684 [Dipteronia sinensis]|uniref:Uncharacterized protein n=1 Tax=Dipteronia sinensis TaxID=43782 RepID=A0AAE0ACE9_9ROSI|nr:hypothetical protein Dsin_015684 [Dipteronia sinensis]